MSSLFQAADSGLDGERVPALLDAFLWQRTLVSGWRVAQLAMNTFLVSIQLAVLVLALCLLPSVVAE